ncbi:DNA-3-methyladenine glycosylase [Radiobacillus sp. PE A8.2]|uniref:DNA-3-methyladenine glycosylase n=1 Tax=Radiobacillus sp. PE A8.2 TaxID=3380349 RepID=UPI00388EDBE2
METEINITNYPPLLQTFYQKPTLILAKSLLGCLLIKQTPEGTTAGVITETEAYLGPDDRAAHSFGNRRTKRTEIMFGEPGMTYTYSMHTHCLFNVVSGPVHRPEAVLIRSVEPFFNLDLISNRRQKVKTMQQWTNGPGKLTKAMGITMGDYGHQLDSPPLWIAPRLDADSFEIASGPRIGIDNAGEARDYPWRFWITGNQFISK